MAGSFIFGAIGSGGDNVFIDGNVDFAAEVPIGNGESANDMVGASFGNKGGVFDFIGFKMLSLMRCMHGLSERLFLTIFLIGSRLLRFEPFAFCARSVF